MLPAHVCGYFSRLENACHAACSALHIAARDGDADALAPLVAATAAAAASSGGGLREVSAKTALITLTGHTALAAAIMCNQNHVIPLLLEAAAQAGGLTPGKPVVHQGSAMPGASSLLVAQVGRRWRWCRGKPGLYPAYCMTNTTCCSGSKVCLFRHPCTAWPQLYACTGPVSAA